MRLTARSLLVPKILASNLLSKLGVLHEVPRHQIAQVQVYAMFAVESGSRAFGSRFSQPFPTKSQLICVFVGLQYVS
jgi:hypothetical protein